MVLETVDAHLRDPTARPLAVAMVVLRSDGRIASVTEAIEPEQARVFADELEQFATKLRSYAGIRSPGPKQRGSTYIAPMISLLFMAATYINENALIDAGLSLAAQLIAAYFAQRRSEPRRI